MPHVRSSGVAVASFVAVGAIEGGLSAALAVFGTGALIAAIGCAIALSTPL